MIDVILEAAKKKISQLLTEKTFIVILKGISPELLYPDVQTGTIDEIIENPFQYFMKVQNAGRQILSFEEYVPVKEFINAQYKRVYILDNNIFSKQYPIYSHIKEETLHGLLNHFATDENEDIESEEDQIIGNSDDIKAITDIFVGLTRKDDQIIGAYSDLEENSKVEEVPLFDPEQVRKIHVGEIDESDCSEFESITDEFEYVTWVLKVLNGEKAGNLSISDFRDDLYQLKAQVQTLAYALQDTGAVYFVRREKKISPVHSRPEYAEILEEFWGKKQFRDFNVYDLNKLEKGEKVTEPVSQEQIISDLVEQTEKCWAGKTDYQDIFVTAPTGAGKSAMFQIPAIYLARKYNLLTIVVSPLIGLMQDQVKGLEIRNYNDARTINSDISPIVKDEIMNDVKEGRCHILYLSPETLLTRSSIEQIIGDRQIGMIIVDEAHIVTTWGKQFRPDYWYLGDHIQKLRSNQMKKCSKSFIIATFTATAIYHGEEDMYQETKNSLHMINPITYLGYVKRDDIKINIDPIKNDIVRQEYEQIKFKEVEKLVKRARLLGKKTLIYFPTVSLIKNCYEYLRASNRTKQVSYYYGPLDKDEKKQAYEEFRNGDSLVMLATKAFGMGIDIDDIEIVAHFAPTGNVCDYVQEIGRAARKPGLEGEAYYPYSAKDFKYINMLHGLSGIRKYQLVEVISKIYELFMKAAKSRREMLTKKRNAMLLDAKNFTYIFENGQNSKPDEDDALNKVKTALLLIQKDFERNKGFSPIVVRPIPLFSRGYFAIEPKMQRKLLRNYGQCLDEIEPAKHICSVNLERIWKKNYQKTSFPRFKYMLYSKDSELEFNSAYTMIPAFCMNIALSNNSDAIFSRVYDCLRNLIKASVIEGKMISETSALEAIRNTCDVSKYKAQSIWEVFISSVNGFRRSSKAGISSSLMTVRPTKTQADTLYGFKTAIDNYFYWLKSKYTYITKTINDGKLYMISDGQSTLKEFSIALGVLESMDVLTFDMVGGADSELYIYINQILSLEMIHKKPKKYQNGILDRVRDRHIISSCMLTFLYESDFTSPQIWDYLEDYFLGKIPPEVKAMCKERNPYMKFGEDFNNI